MIVTVDLSLIDQVINQCYRQYLEDFRRFQVYKGGAGAGKSVFAVGQRTVFNIIDKPGFNVLVVMKIGKNNHDSTFSEILKCIAAWGFENLFDVNHSRGAEEITCKVNRNKILFRGLDDVQKIKSITFETGDLACIIGEEASEMTEEDCNQLDLRLRGLGKIPKHMILVFNPIDSDSWLKSRFFNEKMDPAKGYICETTYHDNEYIDDEYKAELESYKRIDQYYYMVYALNQWGVRSTATVFHNLSVEDFAFSEADFQNRRFGMDFGYNHANAMVGTGWRDGELYVWWEQYARHQLNDRFIASVDETGLSKQYTVKADSAEPDKIAEWNRAGYTNLFPTYKPPGIVERAVDYLKALPKIHIHKARCPNTAREMAQFRYRQLKDGRVLDREFVEINDDCVAALRYAVDDLVTGNVQGHFFIKRGRANARPA
jgi:phage terminase large subunit